MSDFESFLARLAGYKELIDADIADYAKQLRSETKTRYGRWPAEAEIDIFLDLLTRGGKRIRGALVMVGYEMCGGKDRHMILQAARAIEMLHAYILIIDDIQDRSALRRGRPTAHELVAALHKKHHLKGDPEHAGISLALMAALAGAHAAQQILAELDADPELRLRVVSIVNQTMLVTAHGQTLDIVNELVGTPDPDDVDKVLEWKSAQYTIINPLQVGMVLAGANERALEAVKPYAVHAGKAFQITDDILGVYGDEKELGKTPGDDIREGKGTLLTLYALKHATPDDQQFLQRCLGNPDLTDQDFAECRRIIKDSGALADVRKQAKAHVAEAHRALDDIGQLWSADGTDFLRQLALALKDRVA
jgi:geranylgeranyl diphosphate synthase type I